MTWQETGRAMQRKVLDKIWRKIQSDAPLTGFERSFYRVETGDYDYTEADAGMDYKGHVKE